MRKATDETASFTVEDCMKEEQKDPNLFQIVLRTAWECLRRAVVPFVMYLTMSFLLLACMLLEGKNDALMYVLGVACILAAAAYNAYLAYVSGQKHYDAYLIGRLHRQNARLGISSGKQHRVEREYRAWKGFLIGLFVGIPVLICGLIAGGNPQSTSGALSMVMLIMFAGWAIVPIYWLNVNIYFSLLFIVLPVVVTGVTYIVGAMRQKAVKQAEKERMARVEELAREQAENKKRK